MQDRLAELKGRQSMPTSADVQPEDLMPEFTKQSNSIQYCLNRIKDNNKKIMNLKEKHIKATLAGQEKGLSKELEEIVDENTKLCKMVKKDMEIMEVNIAESKQKDPHEPETRIKDISFRALKSKFADVLKETQLIQIEYKGAIKQKMGRQVRIMDPTLTENQVEDICNDPEGAQMLMANKLMGGAHLKLRHAVQDIQDKHKDIMKLERSVNTIHQMFVDMAMMVQAQGEVLDNIEINIQQAEDYMKKANVQLDKAKKSHIKSKKWQCCILITLLIIILAIVLPIVLTKTL